MARLKVRQRGQLVSELPLNEEKEYVAGRKEGSDIFLQGSQSISREHFKIFSQNGQWMIQSLSRFGDLIFQGEKIQEKILEHGCEFSVPPYEFEFLLTALDSAKKDDSLTSENLTSELDSKTVVGVAPSIPFIKIADQMGEATALIRLEGGDSWTAGRDPNCQIHINDNRVSRKQFEVRKQGSLFYITDLGSVNGTFINGNPLKSHAPILLKSGDAITVLSNHLYFELHDPNFKNRLEMINALPPVNLNDNFPSSNQDEVDQHLPVIQNNPNSGSFPPPENWPTPEANQQPMPFPQAGIPAGYTTNNIYPAPAGPGNYPQGMLTPHWPGMQNGTEPAQTAAQEKKYSLEKKRPLLIAAAVIAVLVAYLFSGEDSDNKKGKTASTKSLDPLAKLSPEQQALVKQSYQLAKNYYMQGRYESAKSEIAKIKEFTPHYLESDNIDKMAEQAIYLLNEKAKNEKLEKEKIEREEKILARVKECHKKINSNITSEQMDECLSDVIQFDPTHPEILNLKAKVEQLVNEKSAKELEKKQYQALVAQLKNIFAKAEETQKNSGPLETIAAYEKVIKTKLPDPSGLKKKSEEMIKSIKSEMDKKSAIYISEADQEYEKKHLKEAILALRKAMRVNPTNTGLQDRIDQYVFELKKQMMVYYQEGILEESFGNVDGAENKSGAKEKWKKILELDIPDGEYYKKAMIKLKKYGAI